MKFLVLTLSMGVLASSAFGREKAELTQVQALQAIAIFGGDPLGEHAEAMASRIVRFANESDDVEIIISENLYPWLVAKNKVEHNALLLSAIVAGNVRSQLETRVHRDDSYSAMLFLFRVYQELRAVNKEFRIAVIEEQLALHREGKLQEYIVKKLKADINRNEADVS